MAYAQTNYNEIQGINGKYTIHDIGCFLTSFCNLEADYSQHIDPLTLNNFLRDNNLFIDVDDGIRDDVDWSFIQRWDVNTRVTQLGGPGWPNSNQAIVKFAYTSPRTGHATTHFCKVADSANQMILDSWDGIVKHVSSTVYGQPVAWAIYEHGIPQTVSPPAPSFSLAVQPMVPEHTATRYQVRLGANKWNLDLADFNTIANSPVGTASADPSNPTYVWITDYLIRTDLPQYIYYLEDGNLHQGWNRDDLTIAPLPIVVATPTVIKTPSVVVPKAEKYTVLTKLMAFSTALDAMNKANYSGTDVQPGEYFVWSRDSNAINLTTDNVQNQSLWINSNDNVLPTVMAAAVLQPTAPVPTLPVDPPPVHTEPIDPPTPAPIADIKPQAPKPQYHWIRDDKLPTKLISTNSVPVPMKDLEGKWEAKYGKRLLPAHQTAEYSMYTVIGKTEFWIPDEWRNAGYLYGVDTAFLPDEEPIKPTTLDRNGNGRYDIIDIFDNGIQGFTDWGDKYFKGLKEAVTTVAPKIAPAKQRLNRTIEGITKKVNK